MGRLVPNHLPTGKKAGIGSQIDLPNSELHCVTVKVRLEYAGEISAVDCLGPFCLYMSYYYSLRLATHSSRHTAASDLIEARKVLALPKPRLSVLELCKCTNVSSKRPAFISVRAAIAWRSLVPVPRGTGNDLLAGSGRRV